MGSGRSLGSLIQVDADIVDDYSQFSILDSRRGQSTDRHRPLRQAQDGASTPFKIFALLQF